MADLPDWSLELLGLASSNSLRRKPVPSRNPETGSIDSETSQGVNNRKPNVLNIKPPRSLLDLPNEILYKIIDATITSALGNPECYDVSGHKFEGEDPKTFTDSSLGLYNIDADYLDSVTGRRDYAAKHRREKLYMRPRNYDYHWKQLWLDLGIARTNSFFRHTTWPRVDIILADVTKKYYTHKSLKLRAFNPDTTHFWREYYSKKLLQPCATWKKIYHQYISETTRLTRDELWEIYREKYQAMLGLEQWQWVMKFPAPEWEEESQAEMLARLREERWDATRLRHQRR